MLLRPTPAERLQQRVGAKERQLQREAEVRIRGVVAVIARITSSGVNFIEFGRMTLEDALI